MIFKSVYDQKNRLYIDWDTHYICNFKCSYCNVDEKLNTIYPIDNTVNLLRVMSKLKYNFTMGLLGGEPTIFKDYFYVLDYLSNVVFKTLTESEVYVSTNFHHPLEWFQNHPKYNNVHYWLSLHPEYLDSPEKLNALKEKIIAFIPVIDKQLIISPMLLRNDKYNYIYDYIYEIYMDIKDKHDIDIIYSPQYIMTDEVFDIYPTEDKYNQSVKEFFIDDESFTMNEILNKNINFKGKQCRPNYISIGPDYNYEIQCLKIKGNILKNPIEFLKFKPKDIICPFSVCDDYPKMLTAKE